MTVSAFALATKELVHIKAARKHAGEINP